MLCYIHNYSRPSDGPVVARRAGPPGQLPTGRGGRGDGLLRRGARKAEEEQHGKSGTFGLAGRLLLINYRVGRRLCA